MPRSDRLTASPAGAPKPPELPKTEPAEPLGLLPLLALVEPPPRLLELR